MVKYQKNETLDRRSATIVDVSASRIRATIICNEGKIYVLAVSGLFILHILLVLLLAGLVISDPDEAVYRSGFMNIFETTQSGFQPPGWSYVDLNVIKVLYSPAFLFSKLGFSEITSMRLGSLMYIAVTFHLLLRYLRINASQDQYRKSKWLTLFVFMIPSTFFFTSLASRDSILALFLVLTVFNFLKLEHKIQLHTSLAYSISIGMIFAIKPHYYAMILISAALAGTWNVIYKKKAKKFLILIATLSILPMLYFPGSLDHQINSVKSWQEKLLTVSKSPMSESPMSESPMSESPMSDTRTLSEISKAAIENKALNTFLEWTGVADRIESKLADPLTSEAARARGAITDLGVQKEESPFAYFGKFIKIFLFPVPFLDNGSLLLNLFAVEIVFWLFLYTYFLIGFFRSIRNRVAVSITGVFAGITLMCYLIMSLVTEESTQVALRHRNVFAILLLLNLGTLYRSNQSSKLL